jgi:ABC-type Fe3+ transport system substrate-binding protein
VRRLVAAAKEKGEGDLDLAWSETSLGGSEGAKKFGVLFNLMYGVNVKLNFTPGPSMTDMAGKIAQEAAAGRKASTDILIGTESHFGALLNRNVLEEYDYTKLSPRIRKEFVAPKNIGVEFATIISGITYNTNLIRPSGVPRKLEDVLDPKWKGMIASTQNAAIFDRVAYRPEWGAEKMRAFLMRLSGHVGGGSSVPVKTSGW